MNPILCQHNPKRNRFSLPNDIWKRGLKPQGFSILAYLCYLHTHCKSFIVPGADEIASQLRMSRDMAAEQIAELNRRGLLDQNMVPMFGGTSKNFFSLPSELFFLNIGHGAITVYAYLLYCEDRRTHQCHPSYRTISGAVHLTVATVMKHIAKLADRQFITIQTPSTSWDFSIGPAACCCRTRSNPSTGWNWRQSEIYPKPSTHLASYISLMIRRCMTLIMESNGWRERLKMETLTPPTGRARNT